MLGLDSHAERLRLVARYENSRVTHTVPLSRTESCPVLPPEGIFLFGEFVYHGR
jgi:hypothetical protein